MRATFWGTRGSLASPGLDTIRYGGNTCCVEVRTDADDLIVLDAGTGIRRLGQAIPDDAPRVDVLLSHLHMDHIQGLGFFDCLYRDGFPVHLWGPASTTMSLRTRLSRYLSPPLFPLRLRDLPCDLTLHDVPLGQFEVPGLTATAALVCHPGPTVGYRLDDGGAALAYLSDHEPALGVHAFPEAPRWTSGYDLATDVDLLIHDAQFDDPEYAGHIGWGHSALGHTLAFTKAVGARHLIGFHHDPSHDDTQLDAIYARDEIAAQRELVDRPARKPEPRSLVVGFGRDADEVGSRALHPVCGGKDRCEVRVARVGVGQIVLEHHETVAIFQHDADAKAAAAVALVARPQRDETCILFPGQPACGRPSTRFP